MAVFEFGGNIDIEKSRWNDFAGGIENFTSSMDGLFKAAGNVALGSQKEIANAVAV